MMARHAARFVLLSASIALTASGQAPVWNPHWPGPNQLFVGTCYQPIDRSPEQIVRDISIMKHAGFNVVRMGDLSWDSFEPRQGEFDLTWFDKILDQMQAAGIRVILDIPGAPAPIWMHRKYPGVDLVSQNGTRLPPAERYMDNIADPDYARELGVLAETMLKRWGHHPAVIAVGYNNEIGNGFMSYSEPDRQRFIAWLQHKYGSVETLNQAWATQRWSRRLNRFEDVDLPLADGPGPSERYLDLHRYWSDVTIARLMELDRIRQRLAPDLPAISNLWDYAPRRGFDYLSSLRSYVSFPAEGFYPGDPISGAFGALMTKGDLPTPIWFNEFTAGGGGWYGTPGRSRMYAHLGLLMGAQAALAWTFNSHRGGEEQALFGLVDHDGTPSWKVDEFARIADEYRQLEKYGFPRLTHPQVAIAYSFDSAIDSHPNGPSNTTLQYFRTSYADQVQAAFEPLFKANLDTAIVHIGHADLSAYKLVVVPADYEMDEASAKALRVYVQNGGTAVTTAFSAKVDEHGLWFDTPLPGRLSDVFGLKTNAFYNIGTIRFTLDGAPVESPSKVYEVLETSTAQVVARFDNTPDHAPALTLNRFGKGNALYFAAESQPAAMKAVLEYATRLAGVEPGPRTPEGVFARKIDGRTFFVNTTGETKVIPIERDTRGLLSHRDFHGQIVLPALDADLVP